MLTLLLVAHASAQPVRSPRLNAEAVLLLDADGRTIFEKNADVERAPASLVKLMTLYLAFESIERGRADVEDVVTVSPHASRVGRYRMGLRTGEHVPLRVLLEAWPSPPPTTPPPRSPIIWPVTRRASWTA